MGGGPWSPPPNLPGVRSSLPLSILAAAAFTSAAQAQTTNPPAAPVQSKMSIELQKVGTVKRAVAFAGHAFRVRGRVTPFVAGQEVHIRVYLGTKLIMAKTKHIIAPSSGKTGKFVADFNTPIHGRLHVGVTHDGTGEMRYAHAGSEAVSVISSSLYPGQTGFSVGVMQRLLRDIGYVPGHHESYDERTGRAVLAFRKMSGLTRITSASHTVLRRLINGGGQFEVRFPHQGRHAEGDLSHQVLALINGSTVERLYPISSGKPSTPTVLGTFRIYQRTPGYLPDGMYYSSFFTGGYAIHGYDPSPVYPASHGCLRTPIPDALSIYNWLNFGDYVDTYYRSGHHKHPKPSPNAGP
ncbi:MAG: hypothetical protein QOG68_777 [Solirubrobacteraceae bacterium]|nr:hypothetical protein [Solirubrobacteraceae bacterium]